MVHTSLTGWLRIVLHMRVKTLSAAASLTLLASLALATCCLAQKTSTLTGTVLDSSGAYVVKATVTLIDEASAARRATVTNGEGYFTFSAVQTGTYDVQVQAKGFATWRAVGVQMDAGDQRSIPNIKLSLGQMSEVVKVTATQLGVDVTSPEKSEIINSEEIKRLSTIGRDASELVKFLPGFAISPGGGTSNGLAYDPSLVGFGSTALPGYAANGAAPQSGGVSVISDGASVVDPGDMGSSISNVNMDMVQELKVETSNFSADSAKGPIVINAVGKSGGSEYHGSAYLYARNHALNSNDWLSNYFGTAKPEDRYYYPGANIGGPVKIPGTDFNHDKKLVFWTGFEYYDQTNVNGQLTDFIPTPAMLGGDLSPATIAAALNLPSVGGLTPAQYLTSQCTASYSFGTLSNVGGFCYSPGTGNNGPAYTPMGTTTGLPALMGGSPNPAFGITNGMIPLTAIEMATVAAYAKFFPKPNRTPQAIPGSPTDGFNYVKDLLATHNGFQYRARVDENFTDYTKLYVVFNWEKINDESPAENIYYFPTNTVPFPTPGYSNIGAKDISVNFTHIFSPTLTNELIFSDAYFAEPSALANPSIVSQSSLGFTNTGPYANGQTQLPAIVDYQLGVPSFAMSDYPTSGIYFKKYSYSIGDNLSKQWRTHSMKFGVYGEQTGNNQVLLGNFAQGKFVFASYEYCDTPSGAQNSGLGNDIANFLIGCPQSYTQNSSDPAADMNFKTVSFYATDEWKALKRLTLTYGLRIDHLGPWVDSKGVGLAIWQPTPGMFNPNINPNDPTTWPGISWHSESAADHNIPVGGRSVPLAFVSPRVGLAYDIFGSGKTVIRGGWGAYRFQSSYNDYAGPLTTTLGIGTYSPSKSCTYEQIASNNCNGASTIAPFSIYAVDPHDHEQPVTYNYNFTIDRQLPWDSFLEIGYVGNHSDYLPTEGNLSNQNAIPLGGLFQPDPCPSASICAGISGQVYQPGSGAGNNAIPDYRPYRNYSQVLVSNHIGYANYNAIQAQLKRQKGSFLYAVNYTFSKALGIRNDYRTGYPSDPTNLANNYGVVAFDRTHILNFVYSYQEGNKFHGNRILQGALNGWEISGITGWQSGQDLSVLASQTGANYGLSGAVGWTSGTQQFNAPITNVTILGTPDISLQPLLTCNPTSGLHSISQGGQTSQQFVNGNCFALPQPGQNGAFNLPYVHGPAYFNTDLSVFKNFGLGEKRNLQFRLSGFNFLNHPIDTFYAGNGTGLALTYSDPSGRVFNNEQQAIAGAVPSSTFGYTPYRTGRRLVEVAVKYDF